MTTEEFCGYAVVEVMGHNRYIGFVETVTLAGAGMLKVTVPAFAGDEERSCVDEIVKYIPPTSLYALTPISEEAFLKSRAPRALISARYYPHGEDGEDGEDDL